MRGGATTGARALRPFKSDDDEDSSLETNSGWMMDAAFVRAGRRKIGDEPRLSSALMLAREGGLIMRRVCSQVTPVRSLP